MEKPGEQEISLKSQDFYDFLLTIKQIIFNLNTKNIVQSANSIINKFDNDHPLSYKIIITQMIYIMLEIRKDNTDIYLSFLQEVKRFEDKNQNVSGFLDEFIRFILTKNSQESNYLLHYMIDHNLLEPKNIKNQRRLFFAHYMSEDELKRSKYYGFRNFLFANYEELSKNDWELHKKYIEDGVNTNEIAQIIQNDEIEKLQEISSQTNFDFNQKIKPSPYERCSFINEKDVTLIDYAAFFSSIKCFKYLLMNNANVYNTGKYAIAGGNEEIIHLCEQNYSSFEGAYETAIQFHRNDIFKYLYENKIIGIDNIEKLGKNCVLYYNYEIFSFLLGEGMKINDDIIHKSAKIGNLYLVKYFILSNQIPLDIFVYSSASGNTELVKYILKQNNLDINVKNIFRTYLKFILII